MRSFVLWVFLGLIAVGAAACTGGGSTSVPTTAAPTATTASNVVLLPTPPPTGGAASVTLPGQIGLTPTLSLGPGFTAGTQLFVSTTNYGQTQSAARKTDGTIASCPVVLAVTMYFGSAVPLSSLQALAVQYTSMASFLTAGTFTAQFYDLNETQTKDSPLPPAATNGCATAPPTGQVIASATATGANNTVTFSNFISNSNLASSIATKFGLGSGGSGTIPANEVVGFYVTFSAS